MVQEKRKRDLFSLRRRSNRVFPLLLNEKLNLKPFSEKTQENEILQKTHKYVTCPSLRSSLCGAPFVSYFPKSLMQFYRALYGDAMPVYQPFCTPGYGDRKSTKTSGFHYFDKNDLFLL